MAPPSPLRRAVTGRVLVVAHRGLSATEPENTMRAFRRAVEVGCDMIELDVHLSRDGVPVVIHDDTLERTTDGRGAVSGHTLDELRTLDAGRGERIPTLEEVVEWADAAGVALSVELKHPAAHTGAPPYPDLAERVVPIVRRAAIAARSIVHSFHHPTVRRVRELWPEATTGALYGSGTFSDPLALGRACDASGIHPWWTAISPAVCEAAHAAGMHVHAWGLESQLPRDAVEALVRAGVDSLDANDAGRLRAVLEALPSSTTVQ